MTMGLPRTWLRHLAIMAATLGLLVACQASSPSPAPPASPEAQAGEQPSQAPIDWAAAGDCLGQLRLLAEAARDGRLARGGPAPFAILVHETRGSADDWMTPQGRLIEADLPLVVHGSGDAAAEPCLLEIGPAREIEAEHRTIGEEVVRSTYQSGTRSERNPDYDVAQARVRQAERNLREYAEPDILTVGDPMLDLIGIVAGGILGVFSNSGEHDELDDALSQLASTPRSLDRPVHRPYHFERTVVRARKSAIVPIVLRDRERDRVWRTEIRQRELREFHLLDGLDPRDSEYVQHHQQAVTRLELERWQQAPPEIAASNLVAALLDGPPESGPEPRPETDVALAPAVADEAWPPARPDAPPPPPQPGRGPSIGSLVDPDRIAPAAGPAAAPEATQEDGRAENWLGRAPAAGDPRSASVVAIFSDERRGSGFYVHPNFVLTALSLVEDAILIDIRTADGTAVPGLLALSDASLDLALVHVPKPGVPAALAEGQGPDDSGSLEAFGRVREASSVTARARPDGSRLTLETRQSFSPSLAGGPVFDGERVAGMVAAAPAPADRAASAVPVQDLRRFLESARKEIAALH
jgi:hypothetical protein